MTKKSFSKGDRVQLSDQGLRQFYRRKDKQGTVVADPQDPRFVRVKLDGNKTAATYAVDFWRAAK